jgi:hypothetical protein
MNRSIPVVAHGRFDGVVGIFSRVAYEIGITLQPIVFWKLIPKRRKLLRAEHIPITASAKGTLQPAEIVP